MREAAQRVYPQHLQEAAGASADLHRKLLRPDVGATADAPISPPVYEQCGCDLPPGRPDQPQSSELQHHESRTDH